MTDEGMHAERIKLELQNAGATAWGMLKFPMNYLPDVIAQDEHINGIVYGRYTMGGEGAKTNWESGTLIATNKRVIFLDKKPGFTRQEDIAYDEVSTVTTTKAWPFSAVTLLSKVGNFSLRFAKDECVAKFIRYVDWHRSQPAAA